MAAIEPTADLLQAQVLVYQHSLAIVRSMALKCVVELGIPDIIHGNGGHMALSELAAALHLDGLKGQALRRLLRLLVHIGCFRTESSDDGEETYGLTTFSRLLLKGEPYSSSPFLSFSLSPDTLILWNLLGAWFMGDQPTPFHMHFGKSMWDLCAENPAFNDSTNASMAGDSGLVAVAVVRDCGDVFHGLRSLVDVGGGTGSMARAIAASQPGLKCIVFDLPHVVASPPEGTNVETIGGDMFDHIPKADAVLLKNVLHDWSDEDCIKILKRCKEAIPSKEDGGKVIVIDIVVNSNTDDPSLTEVQYFLDIAMLSVAGKERDEREWHELFAAAGFSDHKIKHKLGLRSLIEVYP